MSAGVLLTLAVVVADDLQPVPDLHARVTDLTNTLDATQKQTLESDLEALEKRKGSQIGVLIVPTTQPEEIAQYSIRVFDAWKLGRKGIDDGVLLIVAKNDHRVRIEVARGLEGAIPDAAAARIIREYITPKFRANDFYGGIRDATDTLTKLIDGEKLPPPMTSEAVDASRINWLFFGALFLIPIIGVLLPAPARGAVIGGLVGGVVAVFAWMITHEPVVSAFCAMGGLLVGLMISFSSGGRYASGSYGSYGTSNSGSDSFDSGSSSSSSSSDSSFSGGGGESAGGGASGSW
jgi:uncharacterized protein